jgi:tetratricopeptide (TPR) repeat protein
MATVAELIAQGNAAVKAGKHGEALELYRKANALDPTDTGALNNIGTALAYLGRDAEAVPVYQQVLALPGNKLITYNNMGNSLKRLGRYAEAVASYQAAIALNPADAKLHVSLGDAYEGLGDFANSLMAFVSAQGVDPKNPGAHLLEGMMRLKLGDFQGGWPKYELRFQAEPDRFRGFPFDRMLRGIDVTGKRVLVIAEQGIGDAFQFLRYCPHLKGNGAREVTVKIRSQLVPFLKRFPGIDRALAKETPFDDFDVMIPMMSLMKLFAMNATNVPNKVPYITVPPVIRPPADKLRVGFVWRGSPTNRMDVRRSIPIADWGPILSRPDVQFVSLQYQPSEAEVATIRSFAPGAEIVRDEVGDFEITLAALAGLDLLICVDTSVGHLAGAAGVPTWVMLAQSPDWRWMLNRTDSPWYPKHRLFRQPAYENWAPTLSEVGAALATMAASHGRAA